MFAGSQKDIRIFKNLCVIYDLILNEFFVQKI